MAYRLKMVQKEILFILFSQNWSIRKINNALNIHRATISRYYQEWKQDQQNSLERQAARISPSSTAFGQALAAQTVPPWQNEVPTDQVGTFSTAPRP